MNIWFNNLVKWFGFVLWFFNSNVDNVGDSVSELNVEIIVEIVMVNVNCL